MKETRGRYLADSARARIRPYFLYSGYRDFASFGQSTSCPQIRTGGYESLPTRMSLSCARMRSLRRCLSELACIFLVCAAAVLAALPSNRAQQTSPELSRTVATWEFLPVVGTRAGLFGNETGDSKPGSIR